jgi:hypothetical protein
VTGRAICATARHTTPAARPGAVVLDLGCGLDSRVFRVDPAAGHRWDDLDFPDEGCESLERVRRAFNWHRSASLR